MPPKKKTPAPIDRPLSKAYLREFGGWVNEYPPGISNPASLRVMENVIITGDGAAKIRPGLSWEMPTAFHNELLNHKARMVSKLEQFYEAEGRLSYLFAAAVRGDSGSSLPAGVHFFVWRKQMNSSPSVVPLHQLTDTVSSAGGFTTDTKWVKFLQLDNKILALSDAGEDAWLFNVGESPVTGKQMRSLQQPQFTIDFFNPSEHWILEGQFEPGLNPVADKLVEDKSTQLYPVTGDHWVNVIGFTTFSHEMGESIPSQARHNRIKRGPSNWDPRKPGVETWEGTAAPEQARDQLLLHLWVSSPDPSIVPYRRAIAAHLKQMCELGATHWNVYAAAWSNQDVAPIEAPLLASVPLPTPEIMAYDPTSPDRDDLAIASLSSLYAFWYFNSLDPSKTHLIPSPATDTNYSTPTAATNGLVAGDRMILVRNPKRPAEIWWTSNQAGKFTRLEPNSGGGRKTLTHGNLYIPSTAVLWQNPQSVDTITVLCEGADGKSTAYYMAPAQVASQSEAVNVMAFEETTATQGTVSPYGVVVHNNALYHPLDDQLQKSTASNYNISHRSMTDDISTSWKELENKDLIDVGVLGNHLYYLVNSQESGEIISDPYQSDEFAGARGNEIWILDTGAEGGRWSRWPALQAVGLQTLMIEGELRMCLLAPEGVYSFDPSNDRDEKVFFDPGSDTWYLDNTHISWKLETNTQGANRAHDAWAHLQQVSVTFGNFQGSCRYGIRGKDIHGRMFEVSKDYDAEPAPQGYGLRTFDFEDHLLVQRGVKEWTFFAESNAQLGRGQISLIQYRYTPLSVNVGYEYGAVETFNYGDDYRFLNPGESVSGVPREGIRYEPIPSSVDH